MSVRTRERTTGCHPIVTGDAIADYAGRVFDFQCAHPELARLTFGEGLELG